MRHRMANMGCEMPTTGGVQAMKCRDRSANQKREKENRQENCPLCKLIDTGCEARPGSAALTDLVPGHPMVDVPPPPLITRRPRP